MVDLVIASWGQANAHGLRAKLCRQSISTKGFSLIRPGVGSKAAGLAALDDAETV